MCTRPPVFSARLNNHATIRAAALNLHQMKKGLVLFILRNLLDISRFNVITTKFIILRNEYILLILNRSY